jgi:hypothetical protein
MKLVRALFMLKNAVFEKDAVLKLQSLPNCIISYGHVHGVCAGLSVINNEDLRFHKIRITRNNL